MIRFSGTAIRLLILAVAIGASVLPGQFLVTTQGEGTIDEIRNGGALVLESEGIGQRVTRRINVTYQGPFNSTAEVLEPVIEGSTKFAISTGPDLPLTLDPDDSLSFLVSFDPDGVGPFSARLTIILNQQTVSQRNPAPISFLINLSGVVADYTISYQLPGGNQLLLAEDGVIPFEDTEIEATQAATVIVTNRGSGPGSVESVAVNGGPVFQASGLQLLPVDVLATRDIRFNLIFEPTQEGSFDGTANINFGFGSRQIRFMGRGVAATFTYDVIQGGQTTSVADGGTITLPPTPIGEEVSAQLRVTNVGTIEGVIGRIALQGTGFRLEDVPVTPATIDINDSFTLNITFTPSDLDDSTGSLVIGDSSFTIIGQGSGPELKYSFTSAAGATDLEPRDTIVFPETDFGQTSQVSFTVNNTGTEAQTITLIAASGNFSAADLPTLPMSLPPGQTLTFNVVFEPLASGLLGGNLSIDSTTFSLSGLGGEPGQVPGPIISGAGGAVGAADQVSTGVSIAEPYPVDVAGTLTIGFESDAFANDPTIQFSTGGRTAPFRIRAGQTQALFANNRDALRFQTGTVTGTIILSATFQIEETRQDITPDNAPELTYNLSTQAPQLLGATIGQINAGTVQVLVTGYSTARTVNTLRLSLGGSNLAARQLDVDAQNAFRTWYQSNQSSGFGSQFTATVTLRVDGEVGDITSVSVEAVNELGNSNAVTANLPEI